ncbi:type II toxin-antitoxin system VapC family toxin [[Limnothrix rosea] IAM M-220]|uniref:type II toxin-antitoxin system VapC family toxin n=1 Tax=[Limnothrix rosea] IAM M-220 TaxID=454133 RepID=UPI00095F04D3|nr:PIN domain-containing protein [[Limnothrix rosea] IAM M-220]OKH16021.1 VapC toxin family PIN domain ribonuclease [[Limnothrix rosea] IAM M-220]
MKVLFDTNIVVASFLKHHSHHKLALPWLEKTKNNEIQGYLSTHSLSEIYSVLTRIPLPTPISSKQAQYLITTNLQQFTFVSLDSPDYFRILGRVAQLNITGGGIFDAIIAEAALKIKADVLLTLNLKHFVRLGDDIQSIARSP